MIWKLYSGCALDNIGYKQRLTIPTSIDGL